MEEKKGSEVSSNPSDPKFNEHRIVAEDEQEEEKKADETVEIDTKPEQKFQPI